MTLNAVFTKCHIQNIVTDRMNRTSRYAVHLIKLFINNVNWRRKPTHLQNIIPAYSLLWYFTRKNKPDIDIKVLTNIINQADKLYEEENYLEAYNILASFNASKSTEIDWRICRALFKMSKLDEYDKQSKHAMILEAFDIITEALNNQPDNADVHKWMAIILDAKLHFEKGFSQIHFNNQIKSHLQQANRLNPNDFTVLYMLGQLHYKLCTLTWFEKKIASLLYKDVPTCNYEEALTYFLKAEQLKPRFYLSNIYMLGKVNYQMGNMYRAHYYLTIAAQMTPNTNQEEEFVNSARKLTAKLENYDVSEEAL